MTYWGVPDADAALAGLLARGAREREPVSEVGGGHPRGVGARPRRGSSLGIIENPLFAAAERPAGVHGPGR